MMRVLNEKMMKSKWLTILAALTFVIFTFVSMLSIDTAKADTVHLESLGNNDREGLSGFDFLPELCGGKYGVDHNFTVEFDKDSTFICGGVTRTMSDYLVNVEYVVIKAGSSQSNPHGSAYWIYRIGSGGATQVFPSLDPADGDFPPGVTPYVGYSVSVSYTSQHYPIIQVTKTNAPHDISHAIFYFDCDPVGSITVQKEIQGPSDTATGFSINIKGGNYDETKTVKVGSPATFTRVPYGDYTVTETGAAANGYKLLGFKVGGGDLKSGSSIDVTVNGDNKNISLVAVNRKLGKIVLQKDFSGGYTNTEQQFKFRITFPGGDTNDYDVTSGEDKVIDGLDYGTYKVEELTTGLPEGYDFGKLYVNGSPVTGNSADVTLGASALSFTVKAENEAWSKIKIIKIDEWTKLPLAGAEFAICDNAAFTGTVHTLVTQADGTAITGKLNAGAKYYVKETQAPDDYVADTDVEEITLKPGVNEVHFANTPVNHCWLKIVKVDSVTGLKINGAVFEIADNEDFTGAVEVNITADGTKIAELVPGDYWVREKTAPPGYKKDTTVKHVDIEWHETEEVQFANTPLGSITIAKELFGGYTDSETEFTFSLKGPETDKTITLKGGESELVSDLPYGEYTITETSPAASGYKLLGYRLGGGTLQNVPYLTVTVGSETRDVSVTAVNKKMGRLVLRKQFTNSGYTNTTQPFTIRVTDLGKNTYTDYDITSGTDKVIGSLEYGSYKIEEISIPEGFLFSKFTINGADAANPATVVIDAQHTDIEAVAYNEALSRLIVRKFDLYNPTKPLQGMHFAISDNPEFSGADGHILINGVTDVNGEWYSEYFKAGTHWYLKETQAPPDYEIDPVVKEITLKIGDNVVNFYDPPINHCWIKIVKVDALTGERLSGAVFEIADNAAFADSFLITVQANGEVTTGDLVPGEWWVREHAAPANYLKDTRVEHINIVLHQTAEVTFSNIPVGEMRVVKIDEDTLEPISGAKFDIRKGSATGELYRSIEITDPAGTVLTDVPAGTYYFIETQAPAGYTLDATPVQVTVETGKTATVVLKNRSNTKILWKKDGLSFENLSGAEFDIYDSNNSFKGHYVTDRDGKVPLTGFEPGVYTAIETKAPAGYKLLETPLVFSITEGQSGDIVILNDAEEEEFKTGDLKIRKVDSATRKPLKGAVFNIYTDSAATELAYANLVSDSNGEILVEGMDPGDYWLKETKAPAGYTRYTGLIKVTVVEGQVTTFEMENTGEQDYQTGTDEYNFIGAGSVLFILGAAFVMFSRKKIRV